MTVGAAWIRSTPKGDELWLASDSRLSGDGNDWDQCPKLITLPRRDMVIAFSGSTRQAYPLMLQLSNAISSYGVAVSGVLEFFDVLGHLERVANGLMTSIRRSPGSHSFADQPEFSSGGDTLIVGGYSRLHGRMVIRSFRYQGSSGWRFGVVRGTPSLGPKRVLALFGDTTAKNRLRYMIRNELAASDATADGGFAFEPLVAIARMLRQPASGLKPLPPGHRPASVGGAPQVMRVLPGARATSFAVRWTHGDSPAEFINGRARVGYERLDAPLLDVVDRRVHLVAPGQWAGSEEPATSTLPQVPKQTSSPKAS